MDEWILSFHVRGVLNQSLVPALCNPRPITAAATVILSPRNPGLGSRAVP